jgi:large subunit ribosomal protein L25
MEKAILKALPREGVGKRAAKVLRKGGVIPAVVYKGGNEAVNLQLVVRELEDILHTKAGANVLITLKIQGAAKATKDTTVIIKEIQHDPIKDGILHVDFNEISMTETLKVNVPLVDKGEAIGVKQDGGMLEHVMWELQVECLPSDIPERIEYDVSELKIGDAVFVKQIVPPSGVKILTDPELIAMIVKPPHVEKPKEEVVEEVAEPELIREKKEKEEAEEEEAQKGAGGAGAKEEKTK